MLRLKTPCEDVKLYHGEKYLVSEAMINSFTWQMNLTVRNLHKQDFAPYMCSSENALGKSDTRIRLQGEGNRKIKFNLSTRIHSLIFGEFSRSLSF